MTRTDRDATRIVRSWLEDGATALPDRILDAVEGQLHAEHQRQAGWLARRFPIMSSNAVRTIAAAAIVVLAAIVGISLLPRTNIGAPSLPPTGSPLPDATAVVPVSLPRPGGVVEPGTYLTAFDPPLTVTVPEGWRLDTNTPQEFGLRVAALQGDSAFVFICHDARAVDESNNVLAEVGTNAEAITAALADRQDLRNLTQPQPATIGGLDGFYLDFEGPDPADTDTDPPQSAVLGGSCGYNAYSEQVTRVGVFDLPDGNVTIWIGSVSGDWAVVEAGTAIVETFDFGRR